MDRRYNAFNASNSVMWLDCCSGKVIVSMGITGPLSRGERPQNTARIVSSKRRRNRCAPSEPASTSRITNLPPSTPDTMSDTRQSARTDLADLERRGLLERGVVGRRFDYYPAPDLRARLAAGAARAT